MKIAFKLAFSYAVQHPARMLLTSLAMVASACIVVWVVSGYDALATQFGEQATEYLGRYDFFIVPEDPKDATLDTELVDALRRDPNVAEVAPVAQLTMKQFINPNAEPGGPGGPGQGGPSRLSKGRQPKPGTDSTNNAPSVDRPNPTAATNGGGAELGPGTKSPANRPRPNSLLSSANETPSAQKGPPGGAPGQRPDSMKMFRRLLAGTPTLVGTDAAKPPYPLASGSWIDLKHPEQRGAVVDKGTAEQSNLKLGDEVFVVFGTKEYRLKIVGIVEEGPSQMGMGGKMRAPGSTKPRTGIEAGPASSVLYVPMALAKHFAKDAAKVNLINIQLKPEAKSKLAEWRKTWEVRVAKSKPWASILGIDDIKAGMAEGMMGSRAKQEAWAATGLSLLAALFIIFTTLSMGVTERIRQFAVLRAVGLTRGQVAQVIAVESTLLALIGWGGGLLAGWGLLAVVAKYQTGLFQNGASLGTWCVVFTGLSAFGGALAASILPAWRAMSVQPLEAMSPRRSSRPNWIVTTVFGVIGLALIAINPILVYVASSSMSSDKLYYIYMAVGCTTMAVGFLLLTPAMILIVEGLIGPWLATILGLEPRLLHSQLGSNLWRTLGTTAALTVGLGLFVAMQIWGYSMLYPFTPGDWHPDMLVSFQRGGLPDSEIGAVKAIEGVQADKCIPLAVEQPKLASDLTGSEEQQSVIRQNNVIMIGLDPEVAFGGDPLVKAPFVDGNAQEAIAKLKEGRNCIVPDHFLKATNLKIGDTFSMIPPEMPNKRVEYKIVGTVTLQGWHWMTKFSGLRRREGRSAAMVFADYDRVRKDFGLTQINFFWLNVDQKYGAAHLEEAKKIDDERQATIAKRPSPGPTGASPMAVNDVFDAKRAAVILIGKALQPIANRNMGEKQPVNGQGTWTMGATVFGESVRISTPDEVRARINARASGMIWASCYLPLITLIVTSLGVVNTVMASVRARRWEFGILRSQGITRSGLFRMILAEGILIGLITCILSLAFGILSGWCGTGISQYVSFFGGLAPPLVIPWAQLSIGFGMAMGLCFLAALWPAISTGRAEPLKLLQEGRAAL
jgi:putative ABC transport system permease protein